ncbi:MAG TPA: lipid-A-disaccharide synthase [Lacipirellulaceae bacterium]|jgi:lipid-A-disaccharide synthase|nr:lipid-A-disaccharide synthase [Lacipirellulaceae bacterium]
MKIFFSVGEPSGDLHGANLIRELRRRWPDCEFVGYGGPRMASAGCRLHADLTKLAVMWFARVLVNIHKFWGLASRADRYFRHERPDAVVLIDYPGFNWWIARRAKAHGIPVFYYGAPQLWAWAGWRIRKMRRFVDHVLCKLPFEEAWYRERGCNATYVGHPYFDQLRAEQLDHSFIQALQTKGQQLVGVLPGSRTQEVQNNFGWFLKAVRVIHDRLPNVRFAVAAFKPSQAELIRRQLAGTELPVEVHVGRTAEIIHACDCAMAVSGSVSLELLYHATPSVILYHISRLAFFVQRFFRKVRYITLVNLLTTDDLFPKRVAVYNPSDPVDAAVLMPEYLTCEDKSRQIAEHILEWLTEPAKKAARVSQLTELKEHVGYGGASRRATDYLVAELEKRGRPVLRTHYPFAAQLDAAARGAA